MFLNSSGNSPRQLVRVMNKSGCSEPNDSVDEDDENPADDHHGIDDNSAVVRTCDKIMKNNHTKSPPKSSIKTLKRYLHM